MKLPTLSTLILALMSTLPATAADDKPAKPEIAIVGGGCFWCTEGAYKIVPGVLKVVSGYSAGQKENPTYEDICTGTTGHAEVVQVTYDANKLSYKDVLDLFFDLHDPTTVTKEDAIIHGKFMPKGTPHQGHDYGTQYRSIIIYETEAQKKIAEQAKADAKPKFADPIVTEIVQLKKFYPAEDYHQDYFKNNPNQPYCSAVVGPKIKKFKEKLEARSKAKP
jgi:peptide-methionine (S)-S-oxide reductase